MSPRDTALLDLEPEAACGLARRLRLVAIELDRVVRLLDQGDTAQAWQQVRSSLDAVAMDLRAHSSSEDGVSPAAHAPVRGH